MKHIDFYNDRILITGGSGLVGTYLKEFISENWSPNTHYVSSLDYDLCNIQEVEKMMSIYKPNIIIHLAARVGGIIENVKYPVEFLEQNVQINTNVLQMAHKYNVEKFIGILSTCIYPNKVNHYPITESDLFKGKPQETNLSYAMAKRLMATHINAYNKQYNKQWCYLIPCNLYGKYDKFDPEKSHFLTALIQKIIDTDNSSNKTIKLLGTGRPLRQFMYARDLAKLIRLMLERNIYTNINVAPNYNYSIKNIVNIALRSLNKEYIRVEFSNDNLDGQYRKDVSSDKLLSYFPDFKFTKLEDGIKIVYDYMTKK
jgi:GDP-L-fucose synthase